MSSVILLNSFQSPNSYVDTAMAMLTAEEYKCLSFAARHILGWQDKISKRRGFISLTMFENGFIDSKGRVFGGTGLTRTTIISATDELTRLLFLIKIGEPTEDGQEWELGDSPDFDGLLARYETRKAQRKLQTDKAREAKRAKREGGLSNRPGAGGLLDRLEVVCSTYQRWFVQQTIAGLLDRLNQIHSQNHLQSQFQIEGFSSFSDAKKANDAPKRFRDLLLPDFGTKPDLELTASTVAPDAAKQWTVAYSQLEIQLDRASFETWLRGTQLVAVNGNVWQFIAKTKYAADMLQHRLYREIRRVLSDVIGVDHNQIKLRFEVAEVMPS